MGLAGRASWAATIRDDVAQSQYASLGAESQYASSGFVYVSSYDVAASGTLIAPGWILTAAHAVTNTNVSGDPIYPLSDIYFGQGATASLSGAITAQAVFVESGWDGDSSEGNDLALIELNTPITSIAPAPLYTSSLGSELTQTATMVGYGYTGTGSAGYTNGTYGTRLGIQNVLDAFGGQTTTTGTNGSLSLANYSSNLMFTDFDEPGDPSVSLMGGTTPLPLEGSSAPGDSGGGLFLTVNGTTYLAGVTDFGITTGSSFTASYGQGNGYTRVSVSDSTSFIDSTLTENCVWIATGGGSWGSSSNWSSGYIPQSGDSAYFTGAITSSATVTLSSTWTIASLNFDSSHSYTIAAGSGGTLVMNGGGGTAAINDSGGNHFISAPVTLSTNTAITVSNSGNTLQISGAIGGSGGITLSGNGTLALDAANAYGGSTTVSSGDLVVAASGGLPTNKQLTIDAGGKVQLALNTGGETLSSLSISANGTLDLGNNHMIVSDSGGSIDSTIRAYLAAGYNGGAWNGTSATSGVVMTSAPITIGSGTYSIGYADGANNVVAGLPSGKLEVAYTLAGDANLDGKVDSADFGILADNYGASGANWDQGDFNYDGKVDSADFGILAVNYGQSAGSNADVVTAADWAALDAFAEANGLMSDVPEPASGGLSLLGLVGAIGLRKRRSASA